MDRNLSRRVEVVFPVEQPDLKQRLIKEILATTLADNVKARELLPDGSYRRVVRRRGGTGAEPGAVPGDRGGERGAAGLDRPGRAAQAGRGTPAAAEGDPPAAAVAPVSGKIKPAADDADQSTRMNADKGGRACKDRIRAVYF